MKTELTTNEKWIYNFLSASTDKDVWFSPTEIGRQHAITFGYNPITHHSSWASPICKKLVLKGLIERNQKGCYRITIDVNTLPENPYEK